MMPAYRRDISSAFAALASVAVSASSVKPTLELIEPLLKAQPELSEGRETVTRLSGSIEVSHVTFSYSPDDKPIFEDLNLVIPARQYVAIVGKSGCGKSTLMRLLLGFEKPNRGAIFYDKKDLSRLDTRSLRRQGTDPLRCPEGDRKSSAKSKALPTRRLPSVIPGDLIYSHWESMLRIQAATSMA